MIKRITGLTLGIAGALGILLSIVGFVSVWRTAEQATVAADEYLTLFSETLDHVNDSLDLASATLDDAKVATASLYTTTLSVGETLSHTQPALDEMAGLVEDDLPQSIEASLVALEAMEGTAGTVDQTLRAMSIFGLADYDPAMPLDESIAEMGEGLEPVPESLRRMGDGLNDTSASLEGVHEGIVSMADHIHSIEQDVADANAALDDYAAVVEELDEQVRDLRDGVARPIRVIAWGTTLLLIWIGLSQLALIQWGVSLWRRADGVEQE